MGGAAAKTADHPAFVYIHAPGKGENHDLQPADQIAILRRLSSFSDKEGTPVTIIFSGRPLRKVPDGSRQGAVQVRYAMPDELARMAEQALQAIGKHHDAVLVTDRADLGKIAGRMPCRLLRAVTFEKALEAVSGPLKREQKEPREPREPREPKEARKPQHEEQPAPAEAPEADDAAPQAPKADTPAPAPKPAAPAPRPNPKPEPPAPKKATDSAILDLIDPL
jgi:hypothetical protein